jgi:hypothetical protein
MEALSGTLKTARRLGIVSYEVEHLMQGWFLLVDNIFCVPLAVAIAELCSLPGRNDHDLVKLVVEEDKKYGS